MTRATLTRQAQLLRLARYRDRIDTTNNQLETELARRAYLVKEANRAGLTNVEIANAAGLTKQRVSQILKGNR